MNNAMKRNFSFQRTSEALLKEILTVDDCIHIMELLLDDVSSIADNPKGWRKETVSLFAGMKRTLQEQIKAMSQQSFKDAATQMIVALDDFVYTAEEKAGIALVDVVSIPGQYHSMFPLSEYYKKKYPSSRLI